VPKGISTEKSGKNEVVDLGDMREARAIRTARIYQVSHHKLSSWPKRDRGKLSKRLQGRGDHSKSERGENRTGQTSGVADEPGGPPPSTLSAGTRKCPEMERRLGRRPGKGVESRGDTGARRTGMERKGEEGT